MKVIFIKLNLTEFRRHFVYFNKILKQSYQLQGYIFYILVCWKIGPHGIFNKKSLQIRSDLNVSNRVQLFNKIGHIIQNKCQLQNIYQL